MLIRDHAFTDRIRRLAGRDNVNARYLRINVNAKSTVWGDSPMVLRASWATLISPRVADAARAKTIQFRVVSRTILRGSSSGAIYDSDPRPIRDRVLAVEVGEPRYVTVLAVKDRREEGRRSREHRRKARPVSPRGQVHQVGFLPYSSARAVDGSPARP